jgi:hypothetical protein
MNISGKAAALAACMLLWSSAHAFAADAFTQACTARGTASASHCACEAKLARASLNQREQSAMIRAMKGDTDGFRTAVSAMGEAGSKEFIAKIRTLKTQTDQMCR